jgi:geranylgeranyl diphosphate synthase type II
VGAVAAGARPERLPALEVLGRHLGAAFQITDDLLNLRADPEDYGKEIGGDLWEGKRTLMLLHALRRAAEPERRAALDVLARRRPTGGPERQTTALLDLLVERGDLSPAGHAELLTHLEETGATETKTLDDVRAVYALIHRTGSLDHAREVARRQAEAAAAALAGMDWFPPSHHRDVLAGLVDYVHERTR